MQFTEDQQKVIDLRDRNILVSAAAGSGKTAVLVERIIQKICDVEHPVDIDKMLIVTFTSASAAEMRERISKAVSDRLEEDPANEHLQKQSALIHNAQITTIDSFCLFLIRNHFHEIDLDPGFRVADEAEGKLLRKDAMADLLEEEYVLSNPAYIHFVECYATNGSEKAVEEAIYRLYDFAISYPWPREWLEERAKDYDVSTVEELYEKKWFQQGMAYLDEGLLACRNRFEQALALTDVTGGPYMYVDNLRNDMEIVDKVLQEKDYEKRGNLFLTQFSRLSTKKDADVDPDLRELVKNMRNAAKESFQSLQEVYFPVSVERTVEDMHICHEIVSELARLTIRFMDILNQRKREKNIVDFSDMEHFALQILLKADEQGRMQPTETAKTYQSHYEEVMIDEYQDSNLVQELLLSSVSGEDLGRYNRFMVGDVKQSIYKFRLARPEIFMEKYEEYTQADGKKQRINLSKNFRSRIEVTESVNLLCSQLMQKEVGGVVYDEYAALYLGADYDAVDDNRYVTELLIATPEEEDDEKVDKIEAEASMIASRIKELVGKLPVRDKSGVMRPATYKDIVILLRSTVGWDETLRKVLAEAGIPLHMTSRTGYFQTTEVQTLINFLRVLDNPLQDVALFGTLKSPIFQFTEEEISTIRSITSYRKCKLYDFMKAYMMGEVRPLLEQEEADKLTPIEECQMQWDSVLQKKIEDALGVIARYRSMVAYTPIRELVRMILQETGYEDAISAMPDGMQRRANLEFLVEQAGAFEQTSFYGLFHFIRYLEEIREQEVDFGEVNILDENADVVRMMTIHKSKGLEFPICFVAGMSKQFNQMDARKNILLDVDLGIGTDYIDPIERVKRKTLRKNIVKQKMEMDTRGEDLRILYVALTRAKEKLILTAYDDKLEKTLQSLQSIKELLQTELPAHLLLEANNYEKLLLAALMRHPVMNPILDGDSDSLSGVVGSACETGMYVNASHKVPMKIRRYYGREILEAGFREQLGAELLQEQLSYASQFEDKTLRNQFAERFEYVYPYENLANLMTKTTVSELKKEAYLEQNDGADELYKEMELTPYLPKFATEEEQEVRGNARGSAYHKVMELLDFTKLPSGVAGILRFMDDKIAQGYMPEEYKKLVFANKVDTFLQSEVAMRMQKAARQGQLFCEQPFVIGIPANRLRDTYPETETLLIQGVIDAFFEEDGEIVVLDYKTDRVDTAQELILRYHAQLEHYAAALEQMLGKHVKQRILYSFTLGCQIEV